MNHSTESSPKSSLSFSSLSLQTPLAGNLASLGFKEMTAIQAKSLPIILEGGDVVAQAKTGSGKTAAFGLGVLNKLKVKKFRIQTLILCPTRELADQVAKDLRKFARRIHNIKILTLCGGVPFGPQVGSLEHGAHIIVGTPGRVEDHVRRDTLKLDHVDTLVLDEADRMLEMGFEPSLKTILSALESDDTNNKTQKHPSKRQTLLFSATYPKEIQAMASRVTCDPTLIKVEEQHDNKSIQQFFYRVTTDENRLNALQLILLDKQPSAAIVFCNTKLDTQQTATYLRRQGFSAAALHGDLSQRDRDQTFVKFSNRSVAILVATDVAARGLDVDNVDLVVNFHIARDNDVHTHRIGRTGRAGNHGIACSFFSEKEAHKVARLSLPECDFPDQQLPSDKLPPESLLQIDSNEKRNNIKAAMVTLQIDGGKKQKVRAGDILGALTNKKNQSGFQITGDDVGKIHIFDHCAYVAVEKSVAKSALTLMSSSNIKGRRFRVRKV